jgi:hypothetical protein
VHTLRGTDATSPSRAETGLGPGPRPGEDYPLRNQPNLLLATTTTDERFVAIAR